MSRHISRREALFAFCSFPVLAALSGCESPVGNRAVKKAVKIVVVVAKKLFKVVSVGIDLVDLAVEIKAIIDGKEETIQARITKEEAEALSNGGRLVIKSADGTEYPVDYSTK
jgi:hypothetical protein